MLSLIVESSCDETSVAIVRDGRQVLSNAVASQIPIHRRFGGVVPELASRNHVRDVQTVLKDALEEAGVSLSDIDGFAATCGPGLVGSLVVGIESAKALAYAMNKPFVGLNHLEGHLTAVLLEDDGFEQPEFPYIGTIVSGGHTDIYRVDALGDYAILGRTRDDAAGEAFDKVAKMLGLPYPGGVEVDRLAKEGNPEAYEFPRPMWTRKHFDFSFSGLKTAVLRVVEAGDYKIEDVCASFQEAVVDVIVMKSIAAAKQQKVDTLIFSGGVACNSRLREKAKLECGRKRKNVVFAPAKWCTDNAAMLGPIAEFYLQSAGDVFDTFALAADSGLTFGTNLRAASATPNRHR